MLVLTPSVSGADRERASVMLNAALPEPTTCQSRSSGQGALTGCDPHGGDGVVSSSLRRDDLATEVAELLERAAAGAPSSFPS
jgi:hypothetical protein